MVLVYMQGQTEFRRAFPGITSIRARSPGQKAVIRLEIEANGPSCEWR